MHMRQSLPFIYVLAKATSQPPTPNVSISSPSHPWPLPHRSMRALQGGNASPQALEEHYNTAMQAGLQSTEEYLDVALARADAVRWKGPEHMADVRAAFQAAHDMMQVSWCACVCALGGGGMGGMGWVLICFYACVRLLVSGSCWGCGPSVRKECAANFLMCICGRVRVQGTAL